MVMDGEDDDDDDDGGIVNNQAHLDLEEPSKHKRNLLRDKNPTNARFNQILRLEKKLSALMKAKNPLCKPADSLRLTIRNKYESFLLEDISGAEAVEIEQALWRLHYKKIEEFRTQIRTISALQRGGGSVDNHTLSQILSPFKAFLSQATNFYVKLIGKLRQSCRLSLDSSVEIGRDDFNACSPILKDFSGRNGNPRDLSQCQGSCCRCLLYLGDLARYQQLYGALGGESRDWSTAANYYRQAAAMWPSSGNPHNQLAVLATYVSDELLAVYYYVRSLAIEHPFVTAKENLRLLFEKNQQRIEKFPGLADLFENSDEFSPQKNSDCGQWTNIDMAKLIHLQKESSEPMQLSQHKDELQKQFQHCFVRLIGIVYTNSCFSEVHKVLPLALCLLQQLLLQSDIGIHAGIRKDSLASPELVTLGELGILHMFAVLIFCIHHANIDAGHDLASSSDSVQISASLKCALCISVKFVSFLCFLRSCAESSWHSVLPAITVFFVWFASQQNLLSMIRADKHLQEVVSAVVLQIKGILANLNCNVDEQTNEFSEMKNSIEKVKNGKPNQLSCPLWEDQELQGFSPLYPIHHKLQVSNDLLPVELDQAKSLVIRLCRLESALEEISDTLTLPEVDADPIIVSGKFSHLDSVMNATLPEVNAYSTIVSGKFSHLNSVMNATLPERDADPTIGVSRPSALSSNEALSFEEWVDYTVPTIQNQVAGAGFGCTSATDGCAKLFRPPEQISATCTDVMFSLKRDHASLGNSFISTCKLKRCRLLMEDPTFNVCATFQGKVSCESQSLMRPVPPSLSTDIFSPATGGFLEQYATKEIQQKNIYEHTGDLIKKEYCLLHSHKNIRSCSRKEMQGLTLGNPVSFLKYTADQTTGPIQTNLLSSSVQREDKWHLPICRRIHNGRYFASELLEQAPQDLYWLDTTTHTLPDRIYHFMQPSCFSFGSSEQNDLPNNIAKSWYARTVHHTKLLDTQNPFVSSENKIIGSNLHIPRQNTTSIRSFVRSW